MNFQRREREIGVARRVALLRMAFGIVWIVDASLKLQPTFAHGFEAQIVAARDGQPALLRPWFDLWIHVTSTAPGAFAYLTVGFELLTGLGLLLGLAGRAGYAAAFLYSLALWAIPEGFGGPYGASSTDVGAGIVYAVVFAALYGLDTLAGEPAWALDAQLGRRLRWWHHVAEPAPAVSPPPIAQLRPQPGGYAVVWQRSGGPIATGKLVLEESGLVLAGAAENRVVELAIAYADITEVKRLHAQPGRLGGCPSVNLVCDRGDTVTLAAPQASVILGELGQLIGERTPGLPVPAAASLSARTAAIR